MRVLTLLLQRQMALQGYAGGMGTMGMLKLRKWN